MSACLAYLKKGQGACTCPCTRPRAQWRMIYLCTSTVPVHFTSSILLFVQPVWWITTGPDAAHSCPAYLFGEQDGSVPVFWVLVVVLIQLLLPGAEVAQSQGCITGNLRSLVSFIYHREAHHHYVNGVENAGVFVKPGCYWHEGQEVMLQVIPVKFSHRFICHHQHLHKPGDGRKPLGPPQGPQHSFSQAVDLQLAHVLVFLQGNAEVGVRCDSTPAGEVAARVRSASPAADDMRAVGRLNVSRRGCCVFCPALSDKILHAIKGEASVETFTQAERSEGVRIRVDIPGVEAVPEVSGGGAVGCWGAALRRQAARCEETRVRREVEVKLLLERT